MAFTVHTLALAAAVLVAVATILIRQGLQDGHSYTGFWLNLAVGVIGLCGMVFFLVPSDALHLRAAPFFIFSGLVGTTMGRLLRFVSIEKVGASVAGAITSLHPFIATAFAILLLGEQVTLRILSGTLVIVVGTILLSASGKEVGFSVRHLAYPFLSASCFGVVQIARKLGLSQTGPLFGAAVNTTTAFIAFTIYLLVTGNRQAMVCRGRSLWYFLGAGVAENAGVLCLIVALSLGDVSVVVPLSGTAPLFVLPMAWVFLRGIETLSWRIVLGAILIVLGVFLLTTEM